MKKHILYILISSVLFSCSAGSGIEDARAHAYLRSSHKLCAADSPEELEMISYDLYKELSMLNAALVPIEELERGAMSGNEEYAAVLAYINLCKEYYERLLSLSMMSHYICTK